MTYREAPYPGAAVQPQPGQPDHPSRATQPVLPVQTVQPVPQPRPMGQGRQLVSTKQRDKELAKTGMAVSMGALVVTGFMRTPQGRVIHMLAGAALIGLSIWHTMLYTNNSRKK